MGGEAVKNGDIINFQVYPKSKKMGLFLGIFLFVLFQIIPAPEMVGEQGWAVISVAVLMLSWWVSEATPIPATALLPIILFPVMDIMPLKSTTSLYGHPIVFLFFGGFVIALAMEKWNLHKRIALFILSITGTHANGIIGGFMLATALLSMWMSNTATTVMMLPIGVTVLGLLLDRDDDVVVNEKNVRNFALSLMLGIAFAANIGGTATLTGTPPNAIFAGQLQDKFNYTVDFATWFMFGLPFALILLLLCWFFVTFVVFPSRLGKIEGAADIISKQREKLGKISKEELMVLTVLSATALLWIFKSKISFIELSDTGIAIAAAVVFFLIPANFSQGKFLLAWEDMQRLPWGILLLFGGGLSLASGMGQSGLVDLVGVNISPLAQYGIFFLLIGVVFAVLMLTECMSNLALITVFLPVLFGISLEIGENPLLFAIPATLAASCAFMLPMATPPNAIVFASGHVSVAQMMKAGVIINIISILLIVLFSYSLIGWAFEIEMGVVPPWAAE